MQKLTGKCKEDFETYLESATSVISMYSFRSYPKSCQNALIIEFLDNVKYEDKPIFSHCFNLYWENRVSFQTHNDICLQAVEMCNKFYNEIHYTNPSKN